MLKNLSGGKRYLVIGGILVTIGLVLSFAMMLDFIPTNFFLAFLTYAASAGGMLMGVAGAALVSAEFKKDR